MDAARLANPVRRRWAIFTAAPHRVMMFGGAMQLILVMVYWSLELGARQGAWRLPSTVIPGVFAHGFLMIYGLFPFFIFGFLMTTYPRWMNGPFVPAGRYVPVFVLLTAGILLYYGGLYVSDALMIAGVATWLAGFIAGYVTLVAVYRAARPRERLHESLLNGLLGLGALGALCYLIALSTSRWDLWPWVVGLGFWGFLVPGVVTVAHRMIPFFSSVVLSKYAVFRPGWTVLAFAAGLLTHGALEILGAEPWLWAVDAPLAALAFYHSRRWQIVRSFEARLLAMLHVAFFWFGLGMSLYTVQSLLALAGEPGSLGRGPLHALAIGFLTSMTVAMATRVTRGHSGRTLVADGLTWAVFCGVSAIAVVRIVAEMPMLGQMAGWLNLLAALGWLLGLGAWAGRYAPIYLRARVDGRPG